jgi:hypothetical protein
MAFYSKIHVLTNLNKMMSLNKNRHLLNVGRALRFQANLPLQFWGESLLTTTYLINHLPTPVLNHKSPYELLYGKPPIYTHLRAFGCLCYATNLQ